MLAKTLIKVAGFQRMAAGLGPCELVRGKVVHLSPGGMPHGGISASVVYLLYEWRRRTRRGRVFTNEAGLITERNPDTARGGDVVYYSFGRLPRKQAPEGFCDVPQKLFGCWD